MAKRGNVIVQAVGIAIFAIILTMSFTTDLSFSVSDTGYPTAFQNPRVSFYGQEYNGQRYNQTADTLMSFNPDGSGGLPRVKGEMTSIFEPKNAFGFATFPSYNPVPTSWSQNLGLYANAPQWNGQSPEAVYTWNISDRAYYMAQFREKWYVSFSVDWTPQEDPGSNGGGVAWGFHPYNELVYHNLNVWFQIDTTPTWYIQGGGTAYEAIGSIRLCENVVMKGRDVNGGIHDARPSEQVSPESAPSIEYIYYNPFGSSSSADVTPETFEGRTLNPAFFRNTTYIHLMLDNFGNSATATSPLGWETKGDVATFCFDVIVFVIGDYQVRDIQNDPTQYGRFTPVTNTGDILSWLLAPSTLAWLVPLAIFGALLIFAPWIIFMVVGIFKAIFGYSDVNKIGLKIYPGGGG